MPPRRATTSKAKAAAPAKRAPAKRTPAKRAPATKTKSSTSAKKSSPAKTTSPAKKSTPTKKSSPAKTKRKRDETSDSDDDSDESESDDKSDSNDDNDQESDCESKAASDDDSDEEVEYESDEDVDQLDEDDSDFSLSPRKKARTSKTPKISKASKSSKAKTRKTSPSSSPPPRPKIKHNYRGIEHLPLEVMIIVIDCLGSYLPLVQLASTSKQIREMLLPFIMEHVSFGCSWYELNSVASKEFRERLLKLHLLRPQVLLFDDEYRPLKADTSPAEEGRQTPPLLPNVRLLKLTHLSALKTGESANITVSAFNVAASFVAKEMPKLKAVQSDVELTETMPTAAHKICKAAWKPARPPKRGRGQKKKKVKLEEEPQPVTSLEEVRFNFRVSNTILRGRVLRTLFEALVPIESLRSLDLRVSLKRNVQSRCRDGDGTAPLFYYPRSCGLKTLVTALGDLPSLEKLKIRLESARSYMAVQDSCLLKHITAVPSLVRLKKLVIEARMASLKDLGDEIKDSPESQLKELHLLLTVPGCVDTIDEAQSSSNPIVRAPSRAKTLFRKLPALQKITFGIDSWHLCPVESSSGGLKPCPIKGLELTRRRVLGIVPDKVKEEIKEEAEIEKALEAPAS